jgi:serpin B
LTTTGSAHAQELTGIRAEGVERAIPAPDAPVDAITAGITDFGYRLSQVAGDPTKNWVASPLSIAYAFAMARAGAEGDTAAEIDRVFGFPPARRDEAFNAATRQVASADRSATVLIGNALFTAVGQRVGKPFLSTLAAQYGAGVYTVDFRSRAATRRINEWVRAQTAGRIRTLFDSLDASTRLVLADAVYLRADWAHPFGEETPTGPAGFTRADGSTVSVPTMRQETDLRYASGDGWQAVELPYAHSDLAMWVMVPSGGRSPGELLSAPSLASIRTALRPAHVGVELPKWNFGSTIDLIGPLTTLGVRRAFDQDEADFSGIQPGLFVGQAIHRADITVDERGTEAAAVTGLSFAASARIPPPLVVRADHPFAFAIVHRPTGLPMFIGHVASP